MSYFIETVKSDKGNPVIAFMTDELNKDDFPLKENDRTILNILNSEHKNTQLPYKISYIFYIRLYLQLKKFDSENRTLDGNYYNIAVRVIFNYKVI